MIDVSGLRAQIIFDSQNSSYILNHSSITTKHKSNEFLSFFFFFSSRHGDWVLREVFSKSDESKRPMRKLQGFLRPSFRSSVPECHFCHILLVTQCQTKFSVGGDCTRVGIQGSEDHWKLSWILTATTTNSHAGVEIRIMGYNSPVNQLITLGLNFIICRLRRLDQMTTYVPSDCMILYSSEYLYIFFPQLY